MKRFINTEFFVELQKVSQKDRIIDTHVLKSMYEDFVTLIFSECSRIHDRTAYRNALEFTHLELSGITLQPLQNAGIFFKQCNLIDCQTNRMDGKVDSCKPASGIACLILASIPAAICYVIGKFAFEAGGFLLSMTAFIPFIIFQMIFQRALTVQGGENIENLVKQIQDSSRANKF